MKNKFLSFSVFTILSLAIIILNGSCFSMRYDMSGGVNIDPVITSFSVQYFDNRATIIEPALSQNFTNKLRAYVENNTKLRAANPIGDLDFSGEIKEYRTTPVAISAGETSAKTRFTITIRVKYTNIKKPDENWDSNFTRYQDFDSSLSFNSVEEELATKIVDEIIEQIFNKAFVNW